MYVGTNDRDVASERTYGREEITEEDEYAVQLDKETSQWPAKEDQYDAGGKGSCSFNFFFPREEDECLPETND